MRVFLLLSTELLRFKQFFTKANRAADLKEMLIIWKLIGFSQLIACKADSEVFSDANTWPSGEYVNAVAKWKCIGF